MVTVSNLSDSASKFERRAGNAGGDYASGVESVSDSEQQDATIAAQDTWEQGVQEAISEGRFESGVRNPTQSWQERASTVGQSRFTSGVRDSGDAWRSGFENFANVLEGLQLDPRGARGSQTNYDRAQQVGQALHNERM